MEPLFANKVVLVAGGTQGISLATAKQFAEDGAHVYITGLSQPALERAALEIGQSVTAVECDVADLLDLDLLLARIKKDHGRLDIVVSESGINEVSEHDDIDDISDWHVNHASPWHGRLAHAS